MDRVSLNIVGLQNNKRLWFPHSINNIGPRNIRWLWFQGFWEIQRFQTAILEEWPSFQQLSQYFGKLSKTIDWKKKSSREPKRIREIRVSNKLTSTHMRATEGRVKFNF